MENQKKASRQPDYKGHLEVAAWIYETKDGKPYISVKINTNCHLFKNEPKPKEEKKASMIDPML